MFLDRVADKPAHIPVDLEDFLEGAGRGAAILTERPFDQSGDFRKLNTPIEEARDRYFIGSVEHGGRRAAFLEGFPCQAKRRKASEIGFFEVEPGNGSQVEPLRLMTGGAATKMAPTTDRPFETIDSLIIDGLLALQADRQPA